MQYLNFILNETTLEQRMFFFTIMLFILFIVGFIIYLFLMIGIKNSLKHIEEKMK